MSSLITNRFALSDLQFKDINIDTELTNDTIRDTSILKKLTGGRKQPIRIERKNQHAYDTTLYAKLFFNTNSINKTIDQTSAYYRRAVIISFPNMFEGIKDDPYLLTKLITKEELSAIFNILMIALRNILKNKGIHLNEKTIEERRIKNEIATDPVKSFLDDAIDEESVETDWITKGDFYDAYVKFCIKHKIPQKPIEAFGKILKKIGYTESKKRRKK